MKKKTMRQLLFGLLLSTSIISCKKDMVSPPPDTCETTFYYYFNKQIPLTKSAKKLTIGFKDKLSYQEAVNILSRYNFLNIPTADQVEGLAKLAFVTINGYRSCGEVTNLLHTLEQDEQITFATQMLEGEHKDEIGLTDVFLVGIKDSNDVSTLKNFADKTNTTIFHSNYSLTTYSLKVNKSTGKDALKMANYFHESNLFDFAEPDFLVTVSTLGK